MSGIAARVTVGVVALLAIAWLAVLEVDQRHRAKALDQAVARNFPAAADSFAAAQRLNPDSEIDVLAALVDASRGDRRAGIAGLRRVLDREPDNVTAWTDLLPLVRGHDPALTRRTIAEIRRLDPVQAAARIRAPRVSGG